MQQYIALSLPHIWLRNKLQPSTKDVPEFVHTSSQSAQQSSATKLAWTSNLRRFKVENVAEKDHGALVIQ